MPPRPLRTLVRVAIVVVALATTTIALTGLGVWNAAHTDDAARVSTTDVIIVLGAAQYDGDPSPVFAGRLEHAALLYEEGRAPTILVLGAGQPGDESTEAEAGVAFLRSLGVPATATVAIPRGSTTLESLRAAARYLRSRDLASAFLVSDPWHNLRIERMAGDLGIDGHASATWTSAAISQRTRLAGYVRETFAYLAYRLLGR